MLTLLLYVLVMAAVVAVVYAIAWLVFGRGEHLPPLESDATLTRLPRAGIAGSDVRDLRFAVVLRGYKQSEVDWALEKLARELDELHGAIIDLRGRDQPRPSSPEAQPSREDDV